ncbi:MAG: o-succinylbenzoate synthase [Salibacteraceae bacterium]
MNNARWQKHTFQFQRPSGTSRGVLTKKHSWFIIVNHNNFEYPAIGEASIIDGLSPDNTSDFEQTLDAICDFINEKSEQPPNLDKHPSIKFCYEMLRRDIAVNGSKILFDNTFTHGVADMLINGLIWMGSPEFMEQQINTLILKGFHCIKIKIGALDFEKELSILKLIRSKYGNELEVRVDANGAFSSEDALSKLERLSAFNIHSIEQPIKPRQWKAMERLCQNTPIPIALDEELIGLVEKEECLAMLSSIKPQYIILKPSLIGGWNSSDEWIAMAEKHNIGWWATSALESNIGLNAIAQYTFEKNVLMPQGLGTGSLFERNFDSPLYLQGEKIKFDPGKTWNLNPLQNE